MTVVKDDEYWKEYRRNYMKTRRSDPRVAEEDRQKNREYHAQNREKISKRKKKYLQENPEAHLAALRRNRLRDRSRDKKQTREQSKKYQRIYRSTEKGMEKERERSRRYASSNREYIRNQQKKYYSSGPENPRSGKWSREEISILVENHSSLTRMQLAFLLERSVASINGKIRRLRKAGIL